MWSPHVLLPSAVVFCCETGEGGPGRVTPKGHRQLCQSPFIWTLKGT